jgi:hypothetical protein
VQPLQIPDVVRHWNFTRLAGQLCSQHGIRPGAVETVRHEYQLDLGDRRLGPCVGDHGGRPELGRLKVERLPELALHRGCDEVEEMPEQLLRIGGIQCDRGVFLEQLTDDDTEHTFALAGISAVPVNPQ